MRWFSTILVALGLVALIGCGGDSNTDTETDAGTGTDTAVDTVADVGIDTGTSDAPILFLGIVSNGFTGARIEGGQLCVIEPAQDADSCKTTDADGLAEWVWLSPGTTNFTSRFTHEDYRTMLYLGRWDDQVAAFYKDELDSTGKITNNFVAFTTTVMNGWLAGGGITPETDAGHIFISVGDGGTNVALDGLTASLSDASGTVVYWGNATSLDANLTASSATGHFIIANVAPGTYTVNVEHPDLECDSAISWATDTPNQFPVPVEADTVTRGAIFCTAK